MPVPYVALLVAASLVTPVANGVPDLNVTPSCQAAARDMTATDAKLAFDSCLQSENRARDQLTQEWAQFSRTERQNCEATVAGFEPTYSELITCLEMEHNLRTAPRSADIPSVDPVQPTMQSTR